MHEHIADATVSTTVLIIHTECKGKKKLIDLYSAS